jgi:hypothetical protein
VRPFTPRLAARVLEAFEAGKPILRQLETPHDHAAILVHHAGDPWAESVLLGLPSCPWFGYRRDVALGRTSSSRIVGLELAAVLEKIASLPASSSKGSP